LKIGALVNELINQKLDAEGWPEETVLKPAGDLRISRKVDKPLPKVEESKTEVIKESPPKETPNHVEDIPDYISDLK
jgi:hypothetical protein